MATIEERIKQRRLQMLVHSYIYYELDKNLVTDFQWATWAKELAQLQTDYPNESAKVIYANAFEGWDGSTGAFLPYKDEMIVTIANRLLRSAEKTVAKPCVKVPPKKPEQFRLF